MSEEVTVGIDLGTTNSEVAWLCDGEARVIRLDGESIMPSVVGLDVEGELLIGTPARNQLAAYPERTVRSIKRKMGSDERVRLGEREYTPPEISAILLRELVRRAEAEIGSPVRKAVITVPAFFDDAQRQATRDAGRIAGLDVLRIVHEPTAAVLQHRPDSSEERLLLVYDLGGGTFDVSLVLDDGELTRVLASHGDTQLGGEDFDRWIADDLADGVVAAGGADPRTDPLVDARLIEAAQAAKHRLTESEETRVREEFVGVDARGKSVHLDITLTRSAFEARIAPLIERTLDSVHEALASAGKSVADLDGLVLVGGSTRSPIVARRLTALTGLEPLANLHPDLCVALGAACLGARLAGSNDQRVLVDITPYTFGPMVVVDDDGLSREFRVPLIVRNTALPISRSEIFYTVYTDQDAWNVEIFQGESPVPYENIRIGHFRADGFSPAPAGNPVECRMTLDLDGILTVEVIEKNTGLSKRVTIEAATHRLDDEELAKAREATIALFRERYGDDAEIASSPIAALEAVQSVEDTDTDETNAITEWKKKADQLLARVPDSQRAMAEEDREEIDDLSTRLRAAVDADDEALACDLGDALGDILYYLEEA